MPEGAPTLAALEDIVALAQANSASVLKVHLENDVHLVRLEPGKVEFRPSPRAPRSLAGDLRRSSRTGRARAGWCRSPAKAARRRWPNRRRTAKAARIESVMQEPMVRAVLDRFPGAEIVAVRDILAESDLPPAADEPEESE